MKNKLLFSLCLSALALSGCLPEESAKPSGPGLQISPWSVAAKGVEAVRFVPHELTAGADLRLAASERGGLLLLDEQGTELARQPGHFGSLDSRVVGGRLLVATLDGAAQQASLHWLDVAQRHWQRALQMPAHDFALSGLCLYRDEATNLHLFLLGEEGQGEQWLLGQGDRLRAEPQRLRSLPMPPNAEYCATDDAAGSLFVNEEGVGVWQYAAGAEADIARRPVDLVAPYGTLQGSPSGMVSVPGGLLLLDSAKPALHLYRPQGEQWQAVARLPLAELQEPEQFDARVTAKGVELLLDDDGNSRLYTGHLDWQPRAQVARRVMPQVNAQVQTAQVDSQGDAADDPAIWVHPEQPELSRILGTNKKQGLMVYGLDGSLLQSLPVGRLNNVDVRSGVELGGEALDLAVASNRDTNSIDLFAIDRASGELRSAGAIRTSLAEIYGICLYQPQAGELHAFANGKDGRFVQYRVEREVDGRFSGRLVREFKLDSQPEGCVADDRAGRLFIGEEDVGVWALDAHAEAPAEMESVLRVGDTLKADVEGISLYHREGGNLLVISSQGNDSYVVLDAQAPYALRGAFRVGLNGDLGIDGTSETDGLDVTSANLGGHWQQGLLVIQDGRKRLPEGTQNFKLVPWSEVVHALALD